MKIFLDRPTESECPYRRIDATYLKVRSGVGIGSVAIIIAVGFNTEVRRHLLGMEIGNPSQRRFGPNPCEC